MSVLKRKTNMAFSQKDDKNIANINAMSGDTSDVAAVRRALGFTADMIQHAKNNSQQSPSLTINVIIDEEPEVMTVMPYFVI